MNRIGKKDRDVIKAFTERKRLAGHKLSTDGLRLDGHWMGGSRIAEWVFVNDDDDDVRESLKIQFNDLGSRSAQQVQRAIAKEAPKFDLKNGRGW